jgi:hypothetical protein
MCPFEQLHDKWIDSSQSLMTDNVRNDQTPSLADRSYSIDEVQNWQMKT